MNWIEHGPIGAYAHPTQRATAWLVQPGIPFAGNPPYPTWSVVLSEAENGDPGACHLPITTASGFSTRSQAQEAAERSIAARWSQ